MAPHGDKPGIASPRSGRGRKAQAHGVGAEARAAAALARDGWEIVATRLRTSRGEIDLVARRDGLYAFVEVKARPTLAEAAHALGVTQRRRLIAAAEAALALHPHWAPDGIRFDVVLVDDEGNVRRIADAFRPDW